MREKIFVDIIGAGVSGLATAYFLNLNTEHLKIRVWEKTTTPGGLAGTFTSEKFTVEKFYHHIFKQDTGIQSILNNLGLEQLLDWRPASTGSYYFNQPYRLSSPLDLLKFKPLPFFDRLRLGLLVLKAKRIKDWKKLDQQTAREFIVSLAGKKVYEVVWQPLLEGKFGQYANDISAAWLWSKLIDRGSSRGKNGFEELGYIKGGFGVIFNEIINTLKQNGHEVHFGNGLRELNFNQKKQISSIVTEDGIVRPTNYVISAVQTATLSKWIPNQFNDYKTDLSKIKFLGNICLVLLLKKSLSKFYWTNVSEPGLPFVGIIEHSNWVGTKEYANQHLVYLSAYVTHQDNRLSMNNQELLTHYLPFIQKMFPKFELNDVTESYVWKADYAQPIVSRGYKNLIPNIQSPIDNLLVCTMAQIYPKDRQVSNGIDMAKDVATYFINEKL